jgi:hypothetical protein
MKARFAVFSMMILTAAMLRAQSPNQQPGSIFGFSALAPRGAPQLVSRSLPAVQQPANPKCPVSMRAQHLSDGSLVKAGKAQPPKGIGQRLHLTIGDPDRREITSAELVIRGFTANGRMVQASAADGGNPNATRSLSVSFSAGDDNTVTADLWMPGMTAVQRIDLNSVTYADGSTWTLAGDLACRVTPDGLMLISAR